MASSSHFRVAATLRDYLKIEYQVKRSDKTVNNGSGTGSSCESHHKLFSKEVMLSACPSVPQQNNSYDCGVFVLQYAEAFMKVRSVRHLLLWWYLFSSSKFLDFI